MLFRSQLKNVSHDKISHVLEGFLLDNQKEDVSVMGYFDTIVDKILDNNGLVDINSLIDQRYSLRTLQRYFNKVIGIGPKSFANILRHKLIVEIMHRKPDCTWDDMVFHGYYFDYSHFKKDFTGFANQKPKDFKDAGKASAISLVL